MISIIDYGIGNLRSVEKALWSLGIESKITSSKDEIKSSSGIILPGVGAFPAAMKNLRERELDELLKEEVKEGKPLIGICLGMQLLFQSSDEVKYTEGLGFIDGHVKKFDIKEKVPHMGWNRLKFNVPSDTLKGIDEGSYVYFVHSYYAQTDKTNVNAYAEYEVDVPAVVSKDNVIGFQFHPEKSGDVGLNILKNLKGLIK
ncbi:imidazole glycerol phosphate synthase subunit HisH [Clostridium folliculivorans]|uniref:Imidazole glycerol phosphate synthase subunit HisH n=1 Tax=Clostridium folliculivorans TaxID=2886038 RepID=A0A9W5Y5B6_9CLOT|nr:imidazole glycerol phosphate synthase subunit HisH [Clostridium folliculivorans]GKU26860.1 imidazole glycerol phosphate synthase subunit HisH [Clostridium folliculivorans]GKU31511.1 imidazole glycerol phosphate synthase subunit HisH [Clostridium folliculivorans]